MNARSAGTRHKAIASVRGLDRKCSRGGKRHLADPRSQLRDVSSATTLPHTQAQVLGSWGISSCTLEDAFIKIALLHAQHKQASSEPCGRDGTVSVSTGLVQMSFVGASAGGGNGAGESVHESANDAPSTVNTIYRCDGKAPKPRQERER